MRAGIKRTLGRLVVLAAGASLAAVIPAAADVFSVTQTGDDGPGSLRQSIFDANAHSGTDTINFQIPPAGTGTYTISVVSVLPTITDTVTIDATTQSDRKGAPNILVNGTGTPGGTNGFNLGAPTTMKGLAIGGFPGAGVDLAQGSAQSTIQGNYLGTTTS